MTRLVNGVLVIEDTEPAKCEDCGKIDELRPYGPGGTKVCFDCAMKDKAGTAARYRQFMDTGKVSHTH